MEEGVHEWFANPKFKAIDRAGVGGWVKYHAAFSPTFVKQVLTDLQLSEHSTILDPFLGSGTTCVVAKSMGISSVGLELNPMAYFVSQAKISWGLEPQRLELLRNKLLELKVQSPYVSEEFSRYFELDDPLLERMSTLGHYIIDELHGEERDFLFAGLLLSLRRIIDSKEGLSLSFVTWTPQRYKIPRVSRQTFDYVLRTQVNKMWGDLRSLIKSARGNASSKILFEDAMHFKSKTRFDAIVTSPPYLSRLDYILSFRIENELALSLRALPVVNLRELRDRMVGTVTITGRSEIEPNWGPITLDLLGKIKGHPAKASISYYYPTILNYFLRTKDWLERVRGVLGENGLIICVVQTSFFKEIEVPLGDIILEIASELGYAEGKIVRRDPVRFHRGLLDPDQRRYSTNRVLHEDVLLLKR